MIHKLIAVAGFMLLSTTAFAAENKTADQVIAEGCKDTPDNFVLSDDWNQKMDVLKAWCRYPSIVRPEINGQRKPVVFVHGSAAVVHDTAFVKALDGSGEQSKPLGTAPRTPIRYGNYCIDAQPLATQARHGDVVFSLRASGNTCAFINPLLPTIPVISINNEHQFIGDTKIPGAILISAGRNYGLAIDYYTPGNGNISSAIPEFAGLVIALNSALIEKGRKPLNIRSIKTVLDSSSDEVYLEVNGARGIYNESQMSTLMSNADTKYYGQLVNLSRAIAFAMLEERVVPSMPPVYYLLQE